MVINHTPQIVVLAHYWNHVILNYILHISSLHLLLLYVHNPRFVDTLILTSHSPYHLTSTSKLFLIPGPSEANNEVSSANERPGITSPPHSTQQDNFFSSSTKPLMYRENDNGDRTQPCHIGFAKCQ